MFEIRIHGRGGQGVVTAAETLSLAAFIERRFAQAIPSFGSERTGAPVVSYCRIADVLLRSREPVSRPDALIIQDPTLRHLPGVFDGLPAGGYLLINSARPVEALGIDAELARLHRSRIAAVDANQIARDHLGRPVPNTALLGAFAALTGQPAFASVIEAVRRTFDPQIAEANVGAATEAFDLVAAAHRERRHA
ncbi:pyruvate ferredoxin oxidoreductase subunit gamma [Glycomyces albus]